MEKVIIKVKNCQTKMKNPGAECMVEEKTAKHWIKQKWARRVKTDKK